MANKPVFRKISTAAEAQKNNNSNSRNSSKEERADVARSSDKPVFKKIRTAWGGDVSSIQTPSQKSPSTTRQQWVATGGGRKSTSPTAGVTATQQSTTKRDTAADNRKKLERLQNQRRQAAMDLDTDTVNRLDREMKAIRESTGKQTLSDRAGSVLSSIMSGSVGQTANAAGLAVNSIQDADHNRRQIARIQKELAAGVLSDGRTITPAMRKTMAESIDRLNREAQKWDAPSSTANRIYRAADQMVDDSAQYQQRAKQGLGKVGSTVVDAATAMGQSTLTNILGAATGTGMAPFVLQAFGGASQEARRGGASMDDQLLFGAASAAKEYVTEKMFGLTLPQKILGKSGAGSIDGMLERGIRNVTERLAKSPGGQRALGGLATWLASGATEGLEEIVGDIIENTIINPNLRGWDPDNRTMQEKFDDALYDGLVGAMSGMMGGVNNLFTYQPGLNSATAQQTDVVDPRVQQIMNTMNAQEQRTAGEAQTVDRSPSTQRETARQAESARSAVPAEVQAILRQEAAVRRSFTGVQDTLGESGRKAFQDAYRQGTDRGNYTGEFLRAYHAGMTGQKNPNGTSGVSFAAYTVGKNDAAASLAREKRAAQAAQVAGEESGIHRDDYVNNVMDSSVVDEVDAVSKALGVRVQMVDQVLNGLGNGNINGSEIQIAKDARDPALRVVGHEWTHRVQELAPDTYRSFRDAVGSLPDVQDAVQILVEQYNEAGIETSYEQALDEATANYAGEMIENSNVLDDFIRKHSTDRTLLQKLRDAIHEIVGKLTGRAKRQAQTVEGKLQAAFEAASKQAESLNNKNTATEGGKARFSLKTVNGKSVVWLEQSSLTNKELNNYKDVANFIAAHIGEVYTIVESGQRVYIGENLPSEYTHSKYTSYLRGADRAAARAKNKAVDGFGELIETAANRRWEKTRHTQSKDAKYGMYRYDSTFAFPVNGENGKSRRVRAYDVELLIRNASDGKKYLYDIVNVKENATTQIDLTKREARSAAYKAATGSDASTKSISADSENVKSRYSLKPGENYIVDLDDSNIDQIKENMTRDEASELLDTQQGLSYRFYARNDPMSRSGYAMFADDYYRNGEAYGGDHPRAFSVRESDLTDIDSLTDKIIEARHETDEATPWELEDYENVSDDEFARLFNPDDIVDSAAAWDNEDLAIWFYNAVAEPNNIAGIKTVDGAIAFDPEIIKRNIPAEIVFTQQTSPRQSLKGTENARELAALKRENESLKERVEYWKGQTRRSQGVTTDQKSVRKAADALVKDYGAEISGSEITGDLQSLYDYIASGKDGKDELTYTEARRRSDAIAGKIAESAVAVDDQTYQEYAELRKYLRDTKLTLSSEDAANIADYADFRKEQFGKLKIGKGERTNVDQIYAELSNQYPEFFNEQRETNVSDQLQRIADVAGQLYTVTEYNPFEGYMGQAVASISNDIMDRFFDLPQTKKTFADRAAEQVQEAKRAGRQASNDAFLAGQMAQGRKDAKRLRSTAEALAKERSRRAEQVQALQERYREKNAARRESQQNRELRAKITRHANALSKKLVSPTDAQHIPENMRTAVARVLDSINQESAYTLDANGKRMYDGSGTPTKRTEAFQNLKEQYQKIAAEGDMVIDPSLFGADNKADGQEVSGKFDEVIHMGETRLADLTNAQLKTMWNVLKTVEYSVKTAGKTLSSEKYSTTKQFAKSLMDGLRTRRNKTGTNTSISLETPYTFFSHFGQTGMDIYRMLRNAQDRQELMSRNVAEKVQNILDGKDEGHGLVGKLEEFRGNNVWKLNTDTRQFTTTEGKKLTLTPAQAMEIYLLSKREQAQAHLMTGGIVQPEILSAATGKPRIERGTESIRLSEKDLQAISNSLTAEQVRMADALQKLTTGILADYGNEASMKAYGYKKFTEEHYWPIRTAKEARHSSVEKSSDNVRAIKNIGMAQALTPKASAALDISGVFDTFSRHASDMIDYAAWLCPMEDANRLFNFKYQDEKGNLTGQNVKFLLDEKGGKGSQEYWTKLMNDIQNGIGGRGFEPLTNWFAKQVGRFKAAAVGANIRVVMQQPTAFFRASVVLSPTDMTRGLAGGVTKGDGWKKALKYSPIAMRKDVGSFDISSPYTLSDRFYGQSGFATKINDKAGSLAGKADALTWGKLWNACEWQVKREKPNLRPGSNEFYSEVNKVFTDMIDQTQVVDGILQRSNIMRSNNDLAQQATAFMGEPIMSLNVFTRSYDAFKYEQDPVKRGKALKKVGRSVAALTMNAVVNAAVQSMADGIRDDDRDKDYWERVWEAFTGITGDEENWAQVLKNITLNGNMGSNLNPLGQIPFVKDILSIAQGYDVSRPDMETFSDLVDAAKTFIDSAGGTGKKTRKEALIGLLGAAAKMVGLPLSNVKRDSMAMLRTIALQSGNIPFQYEIEKFTYNIGSEKNKSRYMALLYDALEQGDYTSFEHIREDLMANMPDIDGAKIDSSMTSLYKKKLDKNPDYTLPKKAMDYIGIHGGYAEEEQEDDFDAGDLDAAAYSKYSDQRAETYRSAEDTINASSAFRSADNETKNRALKNAESFAEATALADASGGKYKISENSWILKAQEAQKKYGIDPGTFSLLRAQVSNLEGLKDKDGETIKNSKSYQIMQLVYTNIRDERQRKAMFEYLGVSKSIQHMNKAAVEEKLRNMRKKAK